MTFHPYVRGSRIGALEPRSRGFPEGLPDQPPWILCQNSECVIVKADLTAEDAEFFAEDAEKNCPWRTSANTSASSAFKRHFRYAHVRVLTHGFSYRGASLDKRAKVH